MSIYVVDASVAVKWLVEEIHAVHASHLLRESNTLLAPNFVHVEIANIIWKKVRRGELTRDEGCQRIQSSFVLPVTTVPAEHVLEAAYEFAVELDRTVYDSLYLAMAAQGQVQMVTADLRLHNAIQASRYAGCSLWIEDVPQS